MIHDFSINHIEKILTFSKSWFRNVVMRTGDPPKSENQPPGAIPSRPMARGLATSRGGSGPCP